MCGIFGIINKETKPINNLIINNLGIWNDTRGGDSCGIFIDDEVEYGVQREKLFYNFIPKSKLLNDRKNGKIIFGHCRNASVGAITEKQAQPVILKNNETNKIEFVLVHNGTITNYKELAKKYIPNRDINGLTDSQVMAFLIYSEGYDIMAEYKGGAVFVTADYRDDEYNPTIRMFKGSSKKYEYDVSAKEERPLYCTNYDDSFIFSSMAEPLQAINPGKVFNISSNIVLKLRNNNLVAEKKIDRSKMFQIQTTPLFQTYGQYNNNYYEDYIDDYGYGFKDKKKTKKNSKKDVKNDSKKESVSYLETIYLENDNFSVSTLYIDKRAELRLDGAYNIGPNLLYFIGGNLLYNKASYDLIVEMMKKNNQYFFNEFIGKFIDKLKDLFPLPIYTYDKCISEKQETSSIDIPFTHNTLYNPYFDRLSRFISKRVQSTDEIFQADRNFKKASAEFSAKYKTKDDIYKAFILK